MATDDRFAYQVTIDFQEFEINFVMPSAPEPGDIINALLHMSEFGHLANDTARRAIGELRGLGDNPIPTPCCFGSTKVRLCQSCTVRIARAFHHPN